MFNGIFIIKYVECEILLMSLNIRRFVMASDEFTPL